MDPYIFTLALGGAGLVGMAVIGAGHLGGHSGGHDVGGHSIGHDVQTAIGDHAYGFGGHAAAPAGTHAATGHAGAHAHGSHTHAGTLKSALLSLMSPRVLFSLLIGFGATGLLLDRWIGGVTLLGAAILGALVFENFIVGPVWNFMFRFASAPAQTLEGSLTSAATATSGFDAAGQGLISIEVDGQVVQCLGTLRETDRELGIRVRAGDQLRVEEVDAQRNRCVVSYVGRAPVAG